ncbi:MAG TPA: CocE/NonD family hydrolase [Puia sp.]|nr:CocE/NonD family hydrolase [Puia sp.]
MKKLPPFSITPGYFHSNIFHQGSHVSRGIMFFMLQMSLLLLTHPTSAQKLYFPKTYYNDSITLAHHIPALARDLIREYRENDEAAYYYDLCRLQIVARMYDSALISINTSNKIFCKSNSEMSLLGSYGFHYKIYSELMASNPENNIISPTAYQSKFKSDYSSLTEKGQDNISYYFSGDLSEYKSDLDAKIKDVKDLDSLTIEGAFELCKSYSIYQVTSATLYFGKEELASIDKEKYIEDDSVLVKMPDGARISLTITRSRKISIPQPVVMMYNIYAGQDPFYTKFIASKGYVGIVANTRGKRLSPDHIEPLEHDAKDAYYIIDWISKQPWCDGKVGMFGGSYLGFAQWSAMKYLHPALKTAVPQVSVGAGIDYPMQNGIYMSYMLQWLHYVMDNKLTDELGFGDTKKWRGLYENWYKNGKSFRSLDTLEGRPDPIFQRWLNHPDYDSYWKNMTPQKEEFAKINIPLFTTTGYWDDDQIGAMYYYQQYHAWNKNPNYFLLIGPYDHGGSQWQPAAVLEGYKIDSLARVPIIDIVFQWFDHILKDSSLPAILQDRVNFEVMGANRWMHVSSLDKMHNDSVVFYLGNKPDDNRYPLLKSKPKTPGYIEQTLDLKDRTELNFKDGDVDPFPSLIDTALNSEKIKLIFVSDPIDNPLILSGAIMASVNLTINKKDVDLVMDLYEQTPDGKYFALNENVQRASYAKDRTRRQLLEPGKIENILLTHTFITSSQLEKGSRIVVMIGVNKNPSWEINYGTGKDVGNETMKDAAEPMKIKWYNSSYVKLPILR